MTSTDQPRSVYHLSECPACTALRATIEDATTLVYHCHEHGPWLSRAHEGSGFCPQCGSPSERRFLGELRGLLRR